ncbi:glycosyltransferase [Brachybacterium sp. GCM10030252]|uniref:glycosyltransferase n=1 Tax=Brachybacterium sp. GCM10030252 TaxID=3273380 RepID=UPI00361D4B9E
MVVVLLLLVVTAVTRSWIAAGVTAIVGVALVAVLAVAVFRVADRFARMNATAATRVSTLERRVSERAREAAERAEADRIQTAEIAEADRTQAAEIAALQADLAGMRKSITVLNRRVREGQLTAIEDELKTLQRTTSILRRRVPEGFLEPVEADLARIDRVAQDAWHLSTESAIQLGRHPRSFLTIQQAADLLDHYLEHDQLLEIAPLIMRYDLLKRLDLGTLRKLYRFYRASGYWDQAVLVLRKIAEKSRLASDRSAVVKLEHEIAVFRNPTSVRVDLPRSPAHDPAGPVLHLVGKVLPETQSGYTLRTHYTARAQADRGLPVAIVGQSGITEGEVKNTTRYTHQGIDYYLLPGPARGDGLVDEWLRTNIAEFAALVRELRPSILHAHSDFYNARIVHAVGAAYGIPTVYETRGFWEESYLSRVITAQHWQRDAQSIFATYGHPAAYTLRRHAEEIARTLTDHNFTLAGVMREHILESGGAASDQLSIVPNAVSVEDFPMQDRDPDLAAHLGLPEDAVTIGYISSMVEYEGIDTLIDAFHMASGRVTEPLHLLLVGDGSHLPLLKQRVEKAGIANVIFTGAVPHEDIVRYYGLIDIFVVPRKKSAVTDLVTPLKPFEAFATGRAVVLSDVDALQEIADESGVAETFRAGYHRDLGRKLVELVKDPLKRRDLGVRAARWVRAQRTWDANVTEYYRVYRQLGYRGPADRVVGAELERRARETGAQAGPSQRARAASREASRTDSSPSEGGQRAVLPPPDTATGADKPFRVVVVAMKPQIAGRIRRNILTLLELGAQVTVVNTTPRDDFFQGIDHPNLSADFVEVRSLAVRYQARMTRQKNKRQAKWDQVKQDRAEKARQPVKDAPEWMTGNLPGVAMIHRGWTAPSTREARQRIQKTWERADKRLTKFARTTRNRRDLQIRDQLKRVHLVNRFVEFWRLSPERIAAHEPDLVVSSDLPGLVGASIAAKRLGVPHLHDCHELYLESTTLRPYERRLLWSVEKTYMRRADSVVVVNETIRDEYEKRYGVRGTVLRNCAPAVPADVRANPLNIRSLAGIPQSSQVVLYQGGLMAGRGLDVCVRAAQHFPEGAHLVFIGKGRILEELQQLAGDLGVTDRVHWLPAVEPGQLPAYTAAADVGLIPYQPVSRNNRYALPNKVFEYTGAGVPFVASDLPELRRIVETARCGEVYDPFDPEQLAAAVRTVLDRTRHWTYRCNAERFGRENTWTSEREILVSEIRRLAGSQLPK